MAIETQQGVAVPKIVRRKAVKYPLATMEVGAMFFVPLKKGRIVNYVSTMARKLDRKFTTRRVFMRETLEHGLVLCDSAEVGATEGYAVWREA